MKGDKEMDKIIKKVNEYAKLSKERELTEEEKKDRDKYRKLYNAALFNEWAKEFGGRPAHVNWRTGEPFIYHPIIYKK